MIRRSALALILLAAPTMIAPAAAAQVSLVAEELRSGSGYTQTPIVPGQPPFSQPTTWNTGPFPDNDRNSITIDPTGALKAKFSILGTASHSRGLIYDSVSWALQRFRIAFEIFQPAAFTLTLSGGSLDTAFTPQFIFGGGGSNIVSLSSAQDWLNPPIKQYSGILQPGGYDLQGFAGRDGWTAPLGANVTGGISGELTVAPEPTSISVLFIGAAVLGLGRHRRRTPAPTSTAS